MDSDLMRWVKAQADDPNANPRFRELYAALEAAREDAAEAKQNGYELGLLAAAREDGWQPIETAPRDGTRILAMIRWPWSDGTDGETQDVIHWHARAQFWVCGTPMNYVQVLDEGVAPTHWRPLPAPPAIDQARGKGVA